MKEFIRSFPQQFSFTADIQNKQYLNPADTAIVLGMGGSQLATDIIRSIDPTAPLASWRNYGLPQKRGQDANSLYIASSYSGNTEETIDAYVTAQEYAMPLAVITSGGVLLEMAKKNNTPYVQIPTGIQPRMATGYLATAIVAIMGEKTKKVALDCAGLAKNMRPDDYEEWGKGLAQSVTGKIPVIYASERNAGLCYTWKIKFNETAKTPAFSNVFPELNHNEMTGFDTVGQARVLSKQCVAIFLYDDQDDERIIKRMELTAKMLTEKEVLCIPVRIESIDRATKVWSSIILADWTSYYLASLYGSEPEQVPMVEEFKKLLAQ
jgi:glucose/mannose-6-phosphate isomerase